MLKLRKAPAELLKPTCNSVTRFETQKSTLEVEAG